MLGFVDDPVREALLASASLLVVPSRFESLSLVLLEGWNHGLAALVNGHCSVLKGQALRANGGALLPQLRRVRARARVSARRIATSRANSAGRGWTTSIANTAGRTSSARLKIF